MIAGIDVGFSGAIAIQEMEGRVRSLLDMPVIEVVKKEMDEVEVKRILTVWNVKHVFIEKASSRPGQNVSAVSRYLCSYGILRGICVGLGVPYTLVHPATWKRIMMYDMDKDKGASIVRAKQLFPDVQLPRKKDHGKADALLICEYGRRLLIKSA